MEHAGRVGRLKAGKVADRTFVSLDENILVANAAKTMYERKECTIIVTRNDPETRSRIPVGIITERDIIYRIVAQNRGPFKVMLKDIMSTPLITVDSEASLEQALSLIKENDISRLPVVNKKGGGIIIGLLTMKMLVKSVSIGKVAQVE
ncbi:CBS domain-containing protein [Nitrososphaera viennensis]|uniref:CBS domain-containing protein n=2 Tax=Nitrososphaera viennensis TaxID=1034015 RepID=A0A977IEF3_9ARCH|nr:CBS domain-containing protein [Nitrososphaera viennensis]AIC14556.1 putative signal-transduction protein [Nitrososphaera viennensis EN76]UVS69526.1 CBS domain-containing protein [Nitrososphaera viennensis]